MNLGLSIASLLNPLPPVKAEKKFAEDVDNESLLNYKVLGATYQFNNESLISSSENEARAKSAYQWADKK